MKCILYPYLFLLLGSLFCALGLCNAYQEAQSVVLAESKVFPAHTELTAENHHASHAVAHWLFLKEETEAEKEKEEQKEKDDNLPEEGFFHAWPSSVSVRLLPVLLTEFSPKLSPLAVQERYHSPLYILFEVYRL